MDAADVLEKCSARTKAIEDKNGEMFMRSLEDVTATAQLKETIKNLTAQSKFDREDLIKLKRGQEVAARDARLEWKMKYEKAQRGLEKTRDELKET